MSTETQLRRNVINEMGAESMNDVNRPDVEVKGGTVFVIEQVENFVLRDDMNVNGDFFASLGFKSHLRPSQASWKAICTFSGAIGTR